MKNIIFVLFTLLFCYTSVSANARTSERKISPKSAHAKSLPKSISTRKSIKIVNLNRKIEIAPNETASGNNRAIAKVKPINYQQAITDYTQEIDAIDSSNLHADEPTTLINNAKKASIYNARGLVKLQLGDKRGAIDDLILAAELFDEVGLMDVSERSMRIVKTLDN
jgi:tetratricopeptide (TPR) repeat protein